MDEESLDAGFSAYVCRNLESVTETMAEITRVLKPGGVAGIVDLGRPAGRAAARLHRAGTATLLPLVGMSIGARQEYIYLHHTLDKHPPPDVLLADTPLELVDTWRLGPMGFVWAALLAKR